MTKRDLRRPLIRLLWRIGSRLSPLFDRPLEHDRIANILVFQGGGIGDIIRLFPAIEALRSAYPDAHIVTLTQFDDNLFRHLRSSGRRLEHIVYDLKGKHNDFLGKIRLVRSLRKRRFDLIFAPNYGLGMIEAMVIAYLIRAPYRLGYDKRGAGFLFTTKKEISTEECIRDQHMELLRKGGVPVSERKGSCFDVSRDEVSQCISLMRRLGVSKGDLVMTVAPEVKSGDMHQSLPEYRAWAPDRYRRLVLELLRKYKEYHPKVIVLGRNGISPSGDGQGLFRSDEDLPPEVLDLSGKTTITEAAALISCSRLFIGNDSGMLHVAVASGTPTVAIFGATSPRQVIPFSERTVTVRKNLSCSPCFSHEPLLDFSCPHDAICIRSVEVTDVMDAVDELFLREPPANG